MADEKKIKEPLINILTAEQEAVLDMYINNLDEFFNATKEFDKTQVEIETLHLKRILTK